MQGAAEASEIQELARRQVESKKKDVAFYDKVLKFLYNRVLIVGQGTLDEFPKVICQPGKLVSFDSGTLAE